VSVQDGGKASLTIVCDAGPTTGIQRLTYREAAKSGHLTVIVARGAAYLRGDRFTLRQFLGFRDADAKRLADRWLLVPHSSHAYGPVAQDVTFMSAMASLRPDGRLTNVRRTRVGSHAVVGVRGTSRLKAGKAVTTLWASARGKPLPLREVTVAPDGTTSVTYSRWNKPVHVRAPSGAFDPTTPQAKPSTTTPSGPVI
jgi:hypothetical protein